MFLRLLLATLLLYSAVSLPHKEKIALLNSLQVGRDEQPMEWQCTGCDQSTRPLQSHIIEQTQKDVKAILSVYQEFTVLAFRYTASVTNVLQDLLYFIQRQDQHAPDGCRVHSEFDKLWDAIVDDTMDDLQRSSHTGHLIITGISLGGALSSLSYVDIQRTNIFPQIQIITFGSPRVGNQNWANWINGKILSQRFYIKGDPIPAAPSCLTRLICNYKQVGIPYQCDQDKQQCVKGSIEMQNQIDVKQMIEDLTVVMKQYIKEGRGDEELSSIIDHIYGYKQITNYTMIQHN